MSLNNNISISGKQTKIGNSLTEYVKKNLNATLKKYFIKNVKKQIKDIKFNANCDDLENTSNSIINLCLPISRERSLLLDFNLDLKGIACSKGSACQSGSNKGSHVLTEILSDDDLSKPSLRFSFSKYNTKKEVDFVISSLKDFIDK